MTRPGANAFLRVAIWVSYGRGCGRKSRGRSRPNIFSRPLDKGCKIALPFPFERQPRREAQARALHPSAAARGSGPSLGQPPTLPPFPSAASVIARSLPFRLGLSTSAIAMPPRLTPIIRRGRLRKNLEFPKSRSRIPRSSMRPRIRSTSSPQIGSLTRSIRLQHHPSCSLRNPIARFTTTLINRPAMDSPSSSAA